MHTPSLSRLYRLLITMACLLAMPALAAPGFTLQAAALDSLSLSDAIHLATQNQPLLQSLDDASSASREAAVAASQLPDPKLKLGITNLPITSSDALHLDRDEQTQASIGYAQDVIPKAKRDAASHVLDAEAEQYQSEQQATRRTIQRDVALAWLDVFEAQRRSELLQRIADEMAAERKVTAARISSGTAQTSEVLRLDSMQAETNDKRLLAQRDERKARAALARWIGVAATRPISDQLPVMAPVASNSNAEIENHPMLQNARQMEAVAQSEVERAQTERLQNWSWEVGYGKRFAGLSDMVTFQVAIDLQPDRANRQDRRAAEKLVLVEKARKLTEDRRRELTAELQSAIADRDIAEAREEEHQKRLIPAADARLSVVQANYSAGRQNLAEVWEARRSVLEIQIDHWGILTDLQRAAIKVGYLLNDQRLFDNNNGAQP